MNQTMIVTFLALAFGVAACGDDGSTPIDGSMDVGGDVGDGSIDCVGMDDGTACGDGFICILDVCSPSECGDGYVDDVAGEACDDGNETPGDGCEPGTCAYSCEDDADCDNGNPCDGAEMCNPSLNRCQAGTPEPGTACTQPSGDDGVCAAGGLCAPPGCGDSVVNGDEDCDDGNDINDDGCKTDCTYTCVEDTDCTDADVCNGVETCDLATHTCTDPADLECDDTDTCTADSCDAEMGCVNALIDGDGDGFAVDTCTTPGLMGDDCDDSNSTIYPGAPELCDMLDNDCDMAIDNDTTIVTCYADSDGDGYGRMSSSMDACTCPAGYIPPRSDGEFDCADRLAAAHPGVTSWFRTATCSICVIGAPRYDYNCDGVDTKRWTYTNHTCSISRGFCSSGWVGSSAPACGARATFQPCSLVRSPTGLFICTAGRQYSATQECH